MIGIDEVGRGCWAGPLLVVAARAKANLPNGLKDSKKLSKKQRENLFAAIKESCDLGEGWVQPAEIDELGLTEAMKLAVFRALKALKAGYDEEIIMDGTFNYVRKEYTNVKCITKADDLYPIVSAASIYAKVARDTYMAIEAHQQFPDYQFDLHVGYGTAAHMTALKLHGVTALHRLSYKPIKAFMGPA